MSKLPTPTLSATVTGKRTNRLKVNKPRASSSGHVMKRYHTDPTARGMDTVTLCISMPAAELNVLDANCARTQMSRSHFLRQAAKHFAEKVKP